jgi:muramoyltetrapeptide carboxypeptidase
MRYAKPLQKGQTIGIVAPSFGCTIEPYITRLKTAREKWEKKGFHLKIGDCVYRSDGLGISTDPRSAAEELTRFYLDDEVSAMISAGGGEEMCETVGFTDFDILRKAEPKWFMDFSDNTNFIFPLVTVAATAAIYGPNIGEFGKAWERSERDAAGLMTGDVSTVKGFAGFEGTDAAEGYFSGSTSPDLRYELTQKKVLHSYLPTDSELREAGRREPVRMQGRLLGGCLDVLENLTGTELDQTQQFLNRYGAVIWVLEACDLGPLQIRRAVWHLSEAGWFDTAAGFVIGRPFAAYGQEVMGVNQYNAVTDMVKQYHVPVIMDADVGHIHPTMPLLMGSMAEVNAVGNDIQIHMERK